MLNKLFNFSSQINYSNETIDILRLIRSENIGPRTFIQLINLFGNAAKALENIAEFSLRGGRTKPIKVFPREDALKELELLKREKSFLLTYRDSNYSRLLRQIYDFPPVLSCKGNPELLNYDKIIAIVGSRNSSVNGRLFASKLAKELVEDGFVTVSGLARGIDTAVHSACTDKTIAVIAGGIDHIYPLENQSLFAKISAEGLIIAELPIGTKPLSKHFPQRNRLISAIALATVIIEAGLKSGSLITANFALEQNREVFAVPGFPLDPRYTGSNRLIKNGAHLLESSKDIIDNIPAKFKLSESLKEEESFNNFKLPSDNMLSNQSAITDTQRKQIFSFLSSTPVTYEVLAAESALPIPVIYLICLELELAGKITRDPGNKISLIY